MNETCVTYQITLRLNLANLAAPIQEVETTINTHIGNVGCEGIAVKLKADVPFDLKVSRELNQLELEGIKRVMEQEAQAFEAKVVSVRRKSGNVSQEAASAS